LCLAVVGLTVEYNKQAQEPIGHRPGFRLSKIKGKWIHPPEQIAHLETGKFYSNSYGLIGQNPDVNRQQIIVFGSSTSMGYPDDLQMIFNNVSEANGMPAPQVSMAARTGLSIQGVHYQIEHLVELGHPPFTALIIAGGGLMLDFQLKQALLHRYSRYYTENRAFSYWTGNKKDWVENFFYKRREQLWYSLVTQWPFYRICDPMNPDFFEQSRQIRLTYRGHLVALKKCLEDHQIPYLLMNSSCPQSPYYQLYQNILKAINPMTSKFANEHGIKILDLQARFKKVSDDHFKDGFHWSPKGDLRAAHWIFDALVQYRLVYDLVP
jgi:hypothetical protein